MEFYIKKLGRVIINSVFEILREICSTKLLIVKNLLKIEYILTNY